VLLVPGSFVPGSQPDGNSLLFTGPHGMVVVDTGRHPAHVARIEAAVCASGRPLRAIVNTHWHLDHVSGNPALRARWPRAAVHASNAIDGALDGFLARYRRSLLAMLADASTDEAAREGFRAEIARIDAGPALRPTRVVDGPRTLRAGGVRLDLHLARHAATAGDVWAYAPVARVLAAGDLVTLPAPFLDTACPDGWRRALDAIGATPFEVLVPGHGGPFDRAQFGTWRAAFDALLDCTAGDAAGEHCATAWVGATRALPGAGDPAFARQLADYYVAQRLRGAARTADCPAAR
jgi:glyoxylase-like metal-dependent hydrolase (beta-lactamase superfamily II)